MSGSVLRDPPCISVQLRYCTEGVRYNPLAQMLSQLEVTLGYTARARADSSARGPSGEGKSL
jgi:hypothetical protein